MRLAEHITEPGQAILPAVFGLPTQPLSEPRAQGRRLHGAAERDERGIRPPPGRWIIVHLPGFPRRPRSTRGPEAIAAGLACAIPRGQRAYVPAHVREARMHNQAWPERLALPLAGLGSVQIVSSYGTLRGSAWSLS
jgi:hypothetical protein